ncbi:MAG: polyprotein [Guiyang Dicistro-like virus 2]|nr:MAG: polyprotein [Guiyang Dicistro-like virus 2]
MLSSFRNHSSLSEEFEEVGESVRSHDVLSTDVQTLSGRDTPVSSYSSSIDSADSWSDYPNSVSTSEDEEEEDTTWDEEQSSTQNWTMHFENGLVFFGPPSEDSTSSELDSNWETPSSDSEHLYGLDSWIEEVNDDDDSIYNSQNIPSFSPPPPYQSPDITTDCVPHPLTITRPTPSPSEREEVEYEMTVGDKKFTVKIEQAKEEVFSLPLDIVEFSTVIADYTSRSPYFTTFFRTLYDRYGEEMFLALVNEYLSSAQYKRGTAVYYSDYLFDTRRHRDEMVAWFALRTPFAEAGVEETVVTQEENTTFSDQRETTEETGYVTGQIAPVMKQTMQEDEWHIRNVMSKPLVLKTLAWSSSDEQGKILYSAKMPGDVLIGPHYNLTSTFVFWRGCPKVRIQLNGTKFHKGLLLVAFIPQYSKANYSDVLFDTSLLLSCPNVLLDASASGSGVLDLPFVHMSTYFNSIQDRPWQFLGQLVVVVFNRLGSTTNASPEVDATLWISFDNCELHQPCHAHPLAFPKSVKMLAEAGVEGLVKGVLPMVKDLVAPMASMTVGDVVGGSSNCDKPTDPVELSRWVPNTVTSLNFGDGMDKSNRLSLSPGTATIGSADLISTTADDMNLSLLTQIPTRLMNVEWSTSQGPTTRIAAVPVYPTTVIDKSTSEEVAPPVDIFTPTLLAYVSRPMKYWRGSLRIRVQVVASMMQTGRLHISFLPGFQSQSFDESNYVNTYTLDLQEKHVIEFVVPFVSERPWLRCDKFITTFDGEGDHLGDISTGLLNFHVLNRLGCPDSTSQSVDVNIYVSAGEDFELAFVSDLSFTQGIGNVVYGESLDTPEMTATRTEEGTVTLTKGGGMVSSMAASTMSENAMDLKTVLRRYQMVFSNGGSVEHKAFLAFANTPDLSGVNKRFGKTGIQCRSNLAHYSELFTFWRGSLRYKLIYHTSRTTSLRITVFHLPGVFAHGNFSVTNISGDDELLWAAMTSTGVQVACTYIQNSVEFEIPFYTPYTQLKTIAGGIDNAQSATGLVLIMLENGVGGDGTVSFELFQSAGDDFALNYLRAAPRVQMIKGYEERRDTSDNAQWLYDTTSKSTYNDGLPKVAEMFTFRNPLTVGMNTAQAVETTANNVSNLVTGISSRLGLTARDGGENATPAEEDVGEDLISTVLAQLGSCVDSLKSSAGFSMVDIAVTVSNLVSGFNSFLQATSLVVKTCAVVTVVSELLGSALKCAKRHIYSLVSNVLTRLNGNKQGNQLPVAESALLSFAPAIVAASCVGLLLGGFNAIPSDSATEKVVNMVSNRMRLFNFGCTSISNLKKVYEQVKELAEWLMDEILGFFAPNMLAQLKLEREFAEVQEWAEFIDEHFETGYAEKANWDQAFKNEVLRMSDLATRYNAFLLQGKIGKEASVIREYVRKAYEMRSKIQKSAKALPFRVDPFCVCIFGTPGVGKSHAVLGIADDVMDDQGYAKEDRVCPVNCTSQYFAEDYSDQPAIYMDDISAFNSEEQYKMFFNLKSNTKFPVEQAFKKDTHFTANFIFTTTNTAYPKPNCLNDKLALWRRRNVLIEMDWATREMRQRYARGDLTVYQEDLSHARFRFRHPTSETAPAGTWFTFPQMMELLKRDARAHAVGQERTLRINLTRLGLPEPVGLRPLPFLQEAQALNAEVPLNLPGPPPPEDENNPADDGEANRLPLQGLARNHADVHEERVLHMEALELELDMAKIEEHDLLSLHNDVGLFETLEWVPDKNYGKHHGRWAVRDAFLNKETITNEWLLLQTCYEHHPARDLTSDLLSCSRYASLNKLREKSRKAFDTLREALSTVWKKAREWLSENCPIVDQLGSWPLKLGAAIAVVGLFVGGVKKVVHACVCASVRYLGFRCPKCGKWPDIENCANRDWLLKEWREMYGPTTQYMSGRLTTDAEESAFCDLRGERFTEKAYGTERKMRSEVGPYNDITAGGKAVRIFANNGPYNQETPGGVRSQVFAHFGQKTEDLLEHRIIPYLYRLRTVARGGTVYVNGLAIGERYVLIPKHFLEVVEDSFDIYHSNAWMTIKKNASRMTDFPNKDLVAFNMPVQFHQHRNLTPHFVSEKDLQMLVRTNAMLCRQITTGQVTLERVEAIAMTEIRYARDSTSTDEAYKVMGAWRYPSSASPGACGSVLISLDDKVSGNIIGLHTAGDGQSGYSQLVTREMVAGFVKKMLGTPLPYCEAQRSRVVPSGHFGKVGSVAKGKGCYQPDKTSIIPTAIHGMVSAPVTAPAVLNQSDPRLLEKKNIMSVGIGKYGTPPLEFDPRHISMVEESLNAEIETWQTVRTPQVLTLEQAIGGIEEAEGMDRLPMATSPGYPFTLSRPRGVAGKAYLFDLERNQILDKELKTAFDARLRMAQRGERVVSIWTCCLKDERRPLAKVASGSTRLFVIPPVDFSLLMRMYTLDFSAAIKLNRHQSFTKVGIDPQSLEWTELYNYIAHHSELVVAGDFERFDGTIPPELIFQFFKHANYFYKYHGQCSELDENVRETLADESVHTVHLAGEEIFVNHCGNESGNPNTVNINSFVNYYYMALAFLQLAEKHSPALATMSSFRKHVRVAAYGDDNLVGITGDVLQWYNQETIAQVLATYGIKYTNETKTGITKWKKLSEATFLKCGFFDHESIRGIKVPRMAEATILELTNWTRIAPDQDELLESNCNDALRFAYFYGSSYFEDLRSRIVKALRSVNKPIAPMTYKDFHYWFLFVCGKLPHLAKSEAFFENVASSGNGGLAVHLNKLVFGIPSKFLTATGLLHRPTTRPRTDSRYAIAIPSGEGKSWLCKHYPHLFVDHDDILLPAARNQLQKHGLSWTELWKILDLDFPAEDKRILLVHHPDNTNRQMIGEYILPKPSYIRANVYQRARLVNPKCMERDARNEEILTLAKLMAPDLFRE